MKKVGWSSNRSSVSPWPNIPRSGKRSCASCGRGRCRRWANPGRTRRSYAAVVAYLESSLDRAAAAHPNPGRTATIRRLTRTEYRNAVRDLLAVDVDVSSLLPADESSYGFDNVTVGDLSPTLLDRYLSAAGKISRLAVGRPGRAPGGETIRVPADLTQEGHIAGLPIGTRGGTVLEYTFPQDGEYEIQIRLTRDRDEHVEGLSEPHEVELLLDRDRVQVFTVKPPQGEVAHATVDQHLKVRTRGPRRSACRRRRVSQEAVAAPGRVTPAVPGALQFLSASAHPAGDLLGVRRRPLQPGGLGRHAQPAAHFRGAAGRD